MKRLFTGLCMAWGNFCFIPGLKRWDEEARPLMLGWLPTVGLAIGLLWALVYFGAVYASLPYLVVVFILTFLPFLLSGFIHVDGFMDCNDALLSRAPLEKKQLILKDSRCGTFAIITIAFTILAMYSAMGSAVSLGIDFVNLVAITVLSRSVSGLEVLLSKPMVTSQYKEMYDKSVEAQENEISDADNLYENEESIEAESDTEITEASEACEESTEIVSLQSTKKKIPTIKSGVYLLIFQLIVILALIGLTCTYYLATGLVVLGTVLGSLISCTIAKKNLGGMNGDIAGYSVIWGELVGILVLSII